MSEVKRCCGGGSGRARAWIAVAILGAPWLGGCGDAAGHAGDDASSQAPVRPQPATGQDALPITGAAGMTGDDASGAPDAGTATTMAEAMPDAGDVSLDAHDGAGDAGADTGDPTATPEGLGEGELEGHGVRVFPAPGASDVCPDPVLRVRFETPPGLGDRGRVQLFDVGQPGTAVATLDMAQGQATMRAGGRSFNVPRPAYLDGDQVIFHLLTGELQRGRTYGVRIEAGVFTSPALSVSDADAWTFTIAESAPAPSAMRVGHDGSGDYCTLRGAFDAIPEGSSTPVVVSVAPGKHHGVALLEGKSGVTVRGAGRDASFLLGENNEKLNGGTASRALIAVDGAADITFESLTVHNLTAQDGGQAEALRLQRCERCVVRDVDALSLQDTLLLSGTVYVGDSYIEGNVDYVWGTGAAFFQRCELKTVGRGGYLVQSRNADDQVGYVFVDSVLSRGPGVADASTFLARVEVERFPASHVSFIDCAMDAHIRPAGWQTTGISLVADLRFEEHGSTDLAGNPLDVSSRHAASTQLTADQAQALRNPARVVGFTPR